MSGVATAQSATADALEQYRRELTGYCYRILGSAFDAEGAVQETMVHAWRSLEQVEGRSSINSALQRARATLATADTTVPAELDADARALLERYVSAFEAYDIDRLSELLHEDAIQSMPPYSLWLQGRESIFTWWLGPGIGCKGSKLVPVGLVNGMPAWGQYKPAAEGGYEPWSVIVPEVSEGRIVELTFFLDTQRLFPVFGLPSRFEPERLS